MLRRNWLVLLFVLAALVALVGFAACSVSDDEEEEDETATVEIKVVRDDFFDLAEDEIIGKALFNHTEGQVGLRIKSRILLETLSRFPNQRIDARLELQNQDAARSEYEPVGWVHDTNEEQIEFVIPLVETIPTLLNFRLLIYHYTYSDDQALKADDDDNDATDDDDNDDNDDNDATDDDNDDDNDDTPEPDRLFEAEAVFTFLVNCGQPGTGD